MTEIDPLICKHLLLPELERVHNGHLLLHVECRAIDDYGFEKVKYALLNPSTKETYRGFWVEVPGRKWKVLANNILKLVRLRII